MQDLNTLSLSYGASEWDEYQDEDWGDDQVYDHAEYSDPLGYPHSVAATMSAEQSMFIDTQLETKEETEHFISQWLQSYRWIDEQHRLKTIRESRIDLKKNNQSVSKQPLLLDESLKVSHLYRKIYRFWQSVSYSDRARIERSRRNIRMNGMDITNVLLHNNEMNPWMELLDFCHRVYFALCIHGVKEETKTKTESESESESESKSKIEYLRFCVDSLSLENQSLKGFRRCNVENLIVTMRVILVEPPLKCYDSSSSSNNSSSSMMMINSNQPTTRLFSENTLLLKTLEPNDEIEHFVPNPTHFIDVPISQINQDLGLIIELQIHEPELLSPLKIPVSTNKVCLDQPIKVDNLPDYPKQYITDCFEFTYFRVPLYVTLLVHRRKLKMNSVIEKSTEMDEMIKEDERKEEEETKTEQNHQKEKKEKKESKNVISVYLVFPFPHELISQVSVGWRLTETISGITRTVPYCPVEYCAKKKNNDGWHDFFDGYESQNDRKSFQFKMELWVIQADFKKWKSLSKQERSDVCLYKVIDPFRPRDLIKRLISTMITLEITLKKSKSREQRKEVEMIIDDANKLKSKISLKIEKSASGMINGITLESWMNLNLLERNIKMRALYFILRVYCEDELVIDPIDYTVWFFAGKKESEFRYNSELIKSLKTSLKRKRHSKSSKVIFELNVHCLKYF